MVTDPESASKVFYVKGDDGKAKVGVRFLDKYIDLSKYEHSVTSLDFSKPLALSMLIGDVDFHSQNMGVRELSDGTRKTDRIDFGRSLMGLSNQDFDHAIIERLTTYQENHPYKQSYFSESFASKLTEFSKPDLVAIKAVSRASTMSFLENVGPELSQEELEGLFQSSLGRVPVSLINGIDTTEKRVILAEEIAEIVTANIEKRANTLGDIAKAIELNSILNNKQYETNTELQTRALVLFKQIKEIYDPESNSSTMLYLEYAYKTSETVQNNMTKLLARTREIFTAEEFVLEFALLVLTLLNHLGILPTKYILKVMQELAKVMKW